MTIIIDIVLPVFGVIFLGYAAAWSRLLPEATGRALADFVFTVGIPVILFRTLVRADLSAGSPWALWTDYFAALALMWFLGDLAMRRLFGRDARAGLVAGISASYSNALLIGIPLVLAAFGEEGSAALLLLIAVHLPVMMTASAVLIERALVIDGVAVAASGREVAKSIGRNLLLNPIIIGIALGLAWNLAGLALPVPVGSLVDRLADAATTLALFSMGMTLRRFGISGNVVPAVALAVLKLAAMPVLVFAMTRWVFPLPPVWAKAMVIAAACPTGVNAFVVAARFRTGEGLSSNAITLTTAAAVVSVTLWLHVLEGL